MEAKLFGALPVGLHAEHGLWSRPPDSASEWSSHCEPSSDWREGVRPVRASLAWHYRMVEPELADRRAQELAPPAGSLQELLGDAPVEIIAGARVIELRPCGVNKGTIVPPLVAAMPAGALIVASETIERTRICSPPCLRAPSRSTWDRGRASRRFASRTSRTRAGCWPL